MESLLTRLNDALDVDMPQAQNVYYEIANSKYRQALMEVFLERKEFVRMQLDPALYERQPCHQINQMLRALDYPVLPVGSPDGKDEESEKLEKAYELKMEELRNLLHTNIRKLQQGCDHIKTDICRVLRNQQMLRPIDHQDISRAVESIRRKHEKTEIKAKQIIANSMMLFQARIADLTKKRRNFSKEATCILQKYYDTHLDHPYPTEEEKVALAEKCHISVQQVSNWFGNRRIRKKKSKRSQDLSVQVQTTNATVRGPNKKHPVEPISV